MNVVKCVNMLHLFILQGCITELKFQVLKSGFRRLANFSYPKFDAFKLPQSHTQNWLVGLSSAVARA